MACSVFPAHLMSTCADPTSFHPHGSFLGLLPLSSVPVHQLLPSKHGSLEEPFPCMLRLSRESGVSTYPLGSLCSVSSSVHCHVLSGLLELYSESPWPHPPCPVQKLPFCLCRALTCPFLFHTAFLTTAWPCPGLFCFGLWFPSSCQLLSLGPSCLADLSPSYPGGPPQGSNQCFAFPRHLLPHKPVTGDVPWFRPCPLHL